MERNKKTLSILQLVVTKLESLFGHHKNDQLMLIKITTQHPTAF